MEEVLDLSQFIWHWPHLWNSSKGKSSPTTSASQETPQNWGSTTISQIKSAFWRPRSPIIIWRKSCKQSLVSLLNVIMTKLSYVFTASLHNCCFIYIHTHTHWMVRAKPNPTYNKVFSEDSTFSAENELEHGKYFYTNTISHCALYE